MQKDPNLHRVKIVCPHCGFSSEQTAAWLAEHPSFHCPTCEQLIDADGLLSDGESSFLAALRNLGNGPKR